MNPLDYVCRLRQFTGDLRDKRKRLHRVAYSWCRDQALADDLVQETLTKGLKNLGQLRKPGAMDRWLFDIMTNCWRDHLRRVRVTEDIDELAELDELCPPDGGHEQAELVAKVRTAVARLPRGQREVLALVDLEGFSYSEVAGMLDIPVGTVTSRICRARDALKEMLEEYDSGKKAKIVRIRRIK